MKLMQSLGQHFLTNKAAIRKIVAALDLRPHDTIIEIGPGEGALTFPLLAECQKLNCKIVAIEKDIQLASSLERLAFRGRGKIEIIRGDILKILPELTKSYKVVGNIPYYITGQLLRILGELKNKPGLTVLMIQREVAERICAKTGEMNLLAAAVQFWAEPKILFTLKPNDFNPPPKVNSAVIQLIPKTAASKAKAESYYKMLHIIFKQPRKTLVNNLWSGCESAGWKTKDELVSYLKKLGLDPLIRPQNLSLNQIELLTTLLL